MIRNLPMTADDQRIWARHVWSAATGWPVLFRLSQSVDREDARGMSALCAMAHRIQHRATTIALFLTAQQRSRHRLFQ